MRRLNVHLRKLEADRVFYKLHGPRSSSPERDEIIAELQAWFDHLPTQALNETTARTVPDSPADPETAALRHQHGNNFGGNRV